MVQSPRTAPPTYRSPTAACVVVLLSGAALGAAILVAVRTRDAVNRRDTVAIRWHEVVPLAPDGPALVVVVDGGCPACRRAKEDLAGDPAFDARALDVRWVDRGDLAPGAARQLAPGRVPLFLRYDAAGELVVRFAGYRSRADVLRRLDAVDPAYAEGRPTAEGAVSLDPSPAAGGP